MKPSNSIAKALRPIFEACLDPLTDFSKNSAGDYCNKTVHAMWIGFCLNDTNMEKQRRSLLPPGVSKTNFIVTQMGNNGRPLSQIGANKQFYTHRKYEEATTEAARLHSVRPDRTFAVYQFRSQIRRSVIYRAWYFECQLTDSPIY